MIRVIRVTRMPGRGRDRDLSVFGGERFGEVAVCVCMCVYVCVCARVRACVCVCVRAYVRVRARTCARMADCAAGRL